MLDLPQVRGVICTLESLEMLHRRVERLQGYCQPVMTGPGTTAREQQLAFFLTLSSPTRIAVIDALKACGPMSEPELGQTLVDAGDLPSQARVNLRRLHLDELIGARLIEKVVVDETVRYQEGPGLAGGISWTDVDEQDEELAAAAQEFERVMVERRINRMRWWATARWTAWPRAWSEASVGRDNVVGYTLDELRELDTRIAALFQELDETARKRRQGSGALDEVPCFRTVSVFPWGTGVRQEASNE